MRLRTEAKLFRAGGYVDRVLVEKVVDTTPGRDALR